MMCIGFDKIPPKQVGYFGQELTETTLGNREFGHTARSATSRCSLADSLLRIPDTNEVIFN
jgi:hypothetical protein